MSKDDKLRFPSEPRIPTKPATFDRPLTAEEEAELSAALEREGIRRGQSWGQRVLTDEEEAQLKASLEQGEREWQAAMGFRPQRFSKALAWVAAALLVGIGFALGFATAGVLFYAG